MFFVICRYAICVPDFFVDLKLSQIRKFFIFLLRNTYSAKQICCQLLDSFAIKAAKKNMMFRSLCLMVENLWICNLRIAHLRNLQICGFAICGSIKRNLRIWNFWTHISQKFADFRLLIEPKNLRICMPTFAICHRFQPYWQQICRWCQRYRWHIAPGINNTDGKICHQCQQHSKVLKKF